MFVRHGELLVFDDLSSALAIETERQLWDRLFAERELTCLVVSHRRAAAAGRLRHRAQRRVYRGRGHIRRPVGHLRRDAQPVEH